MEIEILNQDNNPMLHRSDVRFEVVHNEATPERLSVRDSLAARLNKDAEEVVVHKLDTKYGMRRTVGYAKVYDSPEDAAAVEQEHMLARNKIGDGESAPDTTEPQEDVEPEADDTDAEEDVEPEADDTEAEENVEPEADDTEAEEA